jgi:hypothetical protein
MAVSVWLERARRAEVALPLGALLLVVAGTLALADWRSWEGLNDREALLVGLPSGGARQSTTPPPRTARRVVLIIADGANADQERSLGSAVSLASRGARAAVLAHGPTFSSPAYVTWLSGVDPTDSGVRTNRYRGALPLDSLLSRARAAWLRTLGFDEGPGALLGRLFGPHLTQHIEGADRWPEVFRALPRADLAVLSLTAADVAGHRHGARDLRYLEAIQEVERRIQHVLRAVDLSQDLVVIVSDHGHLARGGHGGSETSVRRLFLVAAGAGIAEQPRTGEMDQKDLAPSLALLLGLPPPAHSRGWIIGWAFSPELEPRFHRAALASLLQARVRVERHLASELGAELSRSGARPEDLVRAALGDTSEAWRVGWHMVGDLQDRVDGARLRYLRQLRWRTGTFWAIGLGIVLLGIVGGGFLGVLRIGAVGILLAPVSVGVSAVLLFVLEVLPTLSSSWPPLQLALRVAAAGSGAAVLQTLAAALPSRRPGDRLSGRLLAAAWIGLLVVGAGAVLTPVAAGAALPELRLIAGSLLGTASVACHLGLYGLVLAVVGAVRRVRRAKGHTSA